MSGYDFLKSQVLRRWQNADSVTVCIFVEIVQVLDFSVAYAEPDYANA